MVSRKDLVEKMVRKAGEHQRAMYGEYLHVYEINCHGLFAKRSADIQGIRKKSSLPICYFCRKPIYTNS